MTQETHIVVKCPDCGDLRVSPEAVTVRSCVDDGAWSYRFTCPSCHRATVGKSVMKPLMEAVDAGAGFEAWTMPTDLDVRPVGPLFTLADVLELHLLLLEPDWFDELRRCELDSER
jgi:predicted RNA-binding Zn-ribbon protein involved in translation (DUF1610 family)